jgi:hypothetical protein
MCHGSIEVHLQKAGVEYMELVMYELKDYKAHKLNRVTSLLNCVYIRTT